MSENGMFEILVPASAELGDDVVLTAWHKNRGDRVEQGDIVAEIEADKGNLDIEAVMPGVIAELLAAEGDSVHPGECIGLMKIRAGSRAAGGGGRSGGGKPSEKAAGKKNVKAAPAARRRALQMGVDLSAVRGSGPDGAVLSRDLPSDRTAPGESSLPFPVQTDANRKAVAEAVTASMREIPSVTFVTDIIMEKISEYRRTLQVSWDAVFISAAARGAVKFPQFTRFWEKGGIKQRRGVNIAFAAAAGSRLYTPVIPAAESLSIREIDAAVRILSRKAREEGLKKKDQEGGSLLVSNLGKYPVRQFEAMVFPGQCASAAVGRIADTPVAEQGGIFIKPVVSVSLTVDHRIINGLEAAEFLGFLKQYLEEDAILRER